MTLKVTILIYFLVSLMVHGLQFRDQNEEFMPISHCCTYQEMIFDAMYSHSMWIILTRMQCNGIWSHRTILIRNNTIHHQYIHSDINQASEFPRNIVKLVITRAENINPPNDTTVFEFRSSFIWFWKKVLAIYVIAFWLGSFVGSDTVCQVVGRSQGSYLSSFEWARYSSDTNELDSNNVSSVSYRGSFDRNLFVAKILFSIYKL